MSKKIKLSSITPDDKNNNKHTAYGMDLLEKSVNKVGIIESITVSNDDKIISGNARHEVIGKHFEKEALVIETDGTQPIVIKRTDIESNTKEFYEASILANTTSKKNIDFDMEVIDSLAVEYDIDVVDLGVDIVDYTRGHEANNMNEDDIDLDDKFDPVGKSDGMQRVVFLFDGPDEAESYLNSLKVDVKKQGQAWQVNLSTQFT